MLSFAHDHKEKMKTKNARFYFDFEFFIALPNSVISSPTFEKAFEKSPYLFTVETQGFGTWAWGTNAAARSSAAIY